MKKGGVFQGGNKHQYVLLFLMRMLIHLEIYQLLSGLNG